MVLYVLSNPKKIGGVFQWEQFIENAIIIYNIDCIFERNDIIYVNNYTKTDFFNTNYLQQLCDRNIKLFFVFHSDLCPINKFFVCYQKYFSGVISTNLYVKQKLQQLLPTLWNIYIPNISKIIPENISSSKSERRIHYVGRLSPEKNLPMLLSAIRLLQNVKLYIYGETNVKYYDYLLNLCNLLQISDKVIFMGFSDSKYDLYNGASCIILPSVHEGLPYCLLEAEAYKIPVIYNDISMISLHLKGHENVNYTYKGYSDLTKILYVNNYATLLKEIGYIEYVIDVKSMINLNKVTDKSGLKMRSLLSIILHSNEKITVGEKYAIPPFLLENANKSNLYEENVQILVNSINTFFGQKIEKINI
jgi:glycosyltransferase involved in cell wall biosynthesis